MTQQDASQSPPDAAPWDGSQPDATNPWLDAGQADALLPDAPLADADSGDASVPGSPVYFDAPMPSSLQTDLTCHVPGIEALQPTVQASLRGSDVTVVLGVDPRFGGIGAQFRLIDNQHPNQGVDVLEPRSGAGAGWQTSFLVTDWPSGVGIIVFNQASGNAVGYQWGYASTLVSDGPNIYATSLVPLPSDHIHESAITTSPCDSNGYLFDDGALDIAGSLVQTDQGIAMAWRNRYRYRSRGDQSWPEWSAEQAFYLSRRIAREHDLRLYLVSGSTHQGPFAIYDPFAIPDATCTNSFCNTPAYDYAVLVWNIAGRDIGVALPDLRHGTSINLEQTTYCSDPSDDDCGNINFHSWLAHEGPVSYSSGQVRTYSQQYFVGTLEQLADLGFAVW